MLTRKTQYAWMALGGLICLFGLVLACKLRDGNKAIAQPEKLELPPIISTTDEKQLSSPPPAMLSKRALDSMPSLPPFQTKEPELLPPSKSEKKDTLQKEKSSAPKATLNMPFPAEPTALPMPDTVKTSTPPPAPASGLPPLGPPSTQSPSVLPASFDASTPAPVEKNPEPVSPPQVNQTSKSALSVGKETSNPISDPLVSQPPSGNKVLLTSPEPKAKLPVKNAKSPEAKSETSAPPSWTAPLTGARDWTTTSDHETAKTQPGEPPLAPAPGPVQLYHVHNRETLQDIARRTLGSSERWSDLHKLNPTLQPETLLAAGTTVRLPADACVQADDAEPVKPLPALRPKPVAPKAKVLPLTGTYQCSLDEKGQLTLPRALRDQLNSSDTVLLSPGPDKCLWLTNQPHLERLGERLEQSQANEADVRVFKRLYFAQTEKLPVNGDGRVIVPERLKEFAGLHQEVVLVGIDDHFEVWDAARWRSYTQQKSAGRYATTAEQE
jgi:MraZ protein